MWTKYRKTSTGRVEVVKQVRERGLEHLPFRVTEPDGSVTWWRWTEAKPASHAGGKR